MKRYIAIDLLALKENKLTLEEWTLLENIYFMSNNDLGYCYASKETLRDIIQVSNGQIYKIITKLIKDEFLTKNKQTGFLKVTQKWINISSGDTLQKMENDSPKNGKYPLQKMETKIDNIKEDIKEEKNINKKSFSLIDELENEMELTDNAKKILTDFVNYRKQIKKPVKTIQPLKIFLAEIRNIYKSDFDIQEAITTMKNNEWQTIKLEWLQNIKNSQKTKTPAPKTNGYQSKAEKTKAFIENYYARKAEALNNEDTEIVEVEVIS